MSSLEACIRKSGKALRKEDADAIRKIRDDIYGVGDVSRDAANQNAVDEYIQILDEERDAVVNQIEERGGVIADRRLSPSDFATKTAERIEEEARKFPRIGMQRETDHRLDMLTMSPEQLHNILTQFDPDLASEILKANGGIEAIRPLQGEARTTVVDLYIENIEPFLSGEPALRYMKDLFGKEIPEPKEKKPEKVETQEDMFGAVTERQRLADFRRRQDRARDEGQEEVETGDVGDLFSQAREQVDIEDVAPSYEIVPNEIQGGFSVLKNNKMMSEWFATEANAQDRIDILTGVREQSVEEAVDESLKKGNNLKYKVEDTFERDNVDANPDNPMAIVAKYGVQMQKAAETTPTKRGGFRGMIDGLVNSGEMHINGILAAVPQSKLKDFIRYGMASVKDYVNEVKLMDAFMNEMMEGHAELGKKWLKFNNANKDGAKLLGEFMHASSLAGVDPIEFSFPDAATFKKMNKTARKMWIKRRADHKELMPFWERLGGMGKQVDYTHEEYNAVTDKYIKTYSMKVSEAQEIYLNVRDTYAEQRTRVIHGLELRILQSEADDASKVKLITQLRRQFEVGKIVPYFPLQRFGKYWVIAKDPEDTDKVVGFFKRENRKDRNKLVAELREAGFVAFPAEEMATDFAAVNKIDPNFVTAVTGLLKEADVVYTDPETGEKTTQPGTEISDEIWQLYLKSLPEMSARKAYIHRKGRLGFTHDALRAFGDNTFHGTHQLAKLKHGYELNRKLRDTQVEAEVLLQQAAMIDNMEKLDYRPEGYEDESMHTVLLETAAPEYHQLYLKYQKENGTQDDPTIDQEAADRARAKLKAESEHDGDWAVPVAKELAKRHEYTMNPKSAAWATNATAFGFMWFLSSSPAAGVLNLTQTAISAYPILRAKFMGAGAGMALWKAFGEYSAIPFSIKQTRIELYGNKLENDKFDDPTQPGKQLQAPDRGEKAALEYFNKIGMFAKTRTRELMGFAERGGQFGGKWQKAAELTGWIFHKSEEMNRVVTAMAAYRLARRKLAGDKDKTELDKHTEAVELAEELVEMSHYDYTNTNRPRLMQGDLGRVVFLFRNYSLNMQYRLIRDFKDGIWKNKNIPEQDRIEARQRFVGIIGMTSMFAGLSGWPLMAGTRFLLDTILGDDDEPFDSRTELRKWMTEAWGETASEAIWKGPWDTMTQATLSSRASLNNLWIREFPQNLRGKDLLLHLAGEGLGPVFGIGLNYMQGFSDLGGGHTDRAIERFVPKAVSDVMKTIRFAQQGAQTYQKDMIMSPEEFTSWDLSVQFMGFTPANLTLRYEQNRAIKDMEARLKTRRTHILNVLFSAYKLGDRAGARDAMQAVLAWNRANPRYPIDANTILRSAQTRAAYDLRTVGGIAVDKRLQYLQNELRFTKRRRRQ